MSAARPAILAAALAIEGLPESLRQARVERGVSRSQVAREAGLSSSVVAQVDRGGSFSSDTAVAILRWLASPSPKPPMELPDDDGHGWPRLWDCTTCGQQGPWGPGWAWFGSYRELEATGIPTAVVCSDVCRRKHAEEARRDAAIIKP